MVSSFIVGRDLGTSYSDYSGALDRKGIWGEKMKNYGILKQSEGDWFKVDEDVIRRMYDEFTDENELIRVASRDGFDVNWSQEYGLLEELKGSDFRVKLIEAAAAFARVQVKRGHEARCIPYKALILDQEISLSEPDRIRKRIRELEGMIVTIDKTVVDEYVRYKAKDGYIKVNGIDGRPNSFHISPGGLVRRLEDHFFLAKLVDCGGDMKSFVRVALGEEGEHWLIPYEAIVELRKDYKSEKGEEDVSYNSQKIYNIKKLLDTHKGNMVSISESKLNELVISRRSDENERATVTALELTGKIGKLSFPDMLVREIRDDGYNVKLSGNDGSWVSIETSLNSWMIPFSIINFKEEEEDDSMEEAKLGRKISKVKEILKKNIGKTMYIDKIELENLVALRSSFWNVKVINLNGISQDLYFPDGLLDDIIKANCEVKVVELNSDVKVEILGEEWTIPFGIINYKKGNVDMIEEVKKNKIILLIATVIALAVTATARKFKLVSKVRNAVKSVVEKIRDKFKD